MKTILTVAVDFLYRSHCSNFLVDDRRSFIVSERYYKWTCIELITGNSLMLANPFLKQYNCYRCNISWTTAREKYILKEVRNSNLMNKDIKLTKHDFKPLEECTLSMCIMRLEWLTVQSLWWNLRTFQTGVRNVIAALTISSPTNMFEERKICVKKHDVKTILFVIEVSRWISVNFNHQRLCHKHRWNWENVCGSTWLHQSFTLAPVIISRLLWYSVFNITVFKWCIKILLNSTIIRVANSSSSFGYFFFGLMEYPSWFIQFFVRCNTYRI